LATEINQLQRRSTLQSRRILGYPGDKIQKPLHEKTAIRRFFKVKLTVRCRVQGRQRRQEESGGEQKIR
jgi:hypothetical protein